MTNRGLCSLDELLRRGDLASLVAGARARSALTEAIRALLPEEEARRLVAAHRDADGTLVLSVDSGAWAARLRYTQAELGAERVRVRVVPAQRADEAGGL